MTPLHLTTVIGSAVAGAGTATIAAAGEIDMANTCDLAAAITATLTDPRVARVVVDLDQVTFLDMSALTGLLRAQAAAEHTGTVLRIVHPHGVVRRVLHLTGTYPVLTGEPDDLDGWASPPPAGTSSCHGNRRLG